MTLLHFPSILFPPRRRRPFRTYIITALPQPRVPRASFVPSPRLVSFCEIIYDRKGEFMGHDRFNSTWPIARFPFTASEFAANVADFFLSFFGIVIKFSIVAIYSLAFEKCEMQFDKSAIELYIESL